MSTFRVASCGEVVVWIHPGGPDSATRLSCRNWRVHKAYGQMNPDSTPLTGAQFDELMATNTLLAIVYSELRRLASAKLRRESGRHGLQTTALVHEAYVRLVDAEVQSNWESRGHFFAAAAEAMRRILVDQARRRNSLKRGGDRDTLSGLSRIAGKGSCDDDDRILAVNEALDQLAAESPRRSQVVKMRFFASMTNEEIAEALDISVPTVKRDWAAARVWIYRQLKSTVEIA